MRNILLLLVALVIAGVTAWYAIDLVRTGFQTEERVGETMPRILVLENTKSFRDPLRQGDIGVREWPAIALSADMIRVPPDLLEQSDIDNFKSSYYNFYINVNEVPKGVPLLSGYISRTRPEELPPPGTQRILVLNRAKQRGEEIRFQDLSEKFWPVDAIAPTMAVVNFQQDINVRKRELEGQFLLQDVPAGFPILSTAFGPEPPPTLTTTGAGLTDSEGRPLDPSVPESASDRQICFDPEDCPDGAEMEVVTLDDRDDVVIFSLLELGDLAFSEEARISLYQVKPANLLAAGGQRDSQGGADGIRPSRDFLRGVSWSVEELIVGNLRVRRDEGPQAGPLGVRFYVELDPAEARHVTLARESGQLRVKSADDANLERFNLFCVQGRCYTDRSVNMLETLAPTGDGEQQATLPGFRGPSGRMFDDPGFIPGDGFDIPPALDEDPFFTDPFAVDFEEPLAEGLSLESPDEDIFALPPVDAEDFGDIPEDDLEPVDLDAPF